MKVVYYDKIELEKKGDEKTAIRFTLNPDGERERFCRRARPE